jgi:hypothetical protein
MSYEIQFSRFSLKPTSLHSLNVYAMLLVCVSVGVPAGGLRLVRPDGMSQFSKVADGGLEKIPSSFSPNSRPGAIRPPCPSQVLPIPGQGVIQIPVEGRGTTDLQMFVNRVRPSQQFLAPGETGGPTVPQQHFSPGSQKQATYITTTEQPLSQFSIQPDVIMKTDPHAELGEQATAIGDNTGMLVMLYVVDFCSCLNFSCLYLSAYALILWSTHN